MIETDASDLAKEAVLSQYEEGDKKWHPVAFYSKKFSPAELNYDVHDKEMVDIVDCMRQWRHMLVGCPRRVVVYTDHRNLEYFQYTKILSRRQARWAELLSEFNFVITYRSGEKNGKADALSRRTDPMLERGDMPEISMFKPGQLTPLDPTNTRVMRITALKDGDELLSKYVISVRAKEREPIELHKKILEAGLKDDQWMSFKRALLSGKVYDTLSLEDGLVFYKKRIYIPDSNDLKLTVTRQYHNAKVAGHFGRDKTMELMTRNS